MSELVVDEDGNSSETQNECADFLGRDFDNCTGEGHDGRPRPRQNIVDAFRLANGLDPLPKRKCSAKSGPKPPKEQKPRAPAPARIPRAAVGDRLEQTLRALGITKLRPEKRRDGAVCQSCQRMQARMNAAGIEGCRQDIDKYAAELFERASDYNTGDWMAAAAKAVTSGLAFQLNPFSPFRSLIEYAIAAEERRIEEAKAAVAAAAIPN